MNVYSSFTHNCQNLEAAKMAFNEWMDKQTVVHLYIRIWFSTRKKWAIKAHKDLEKA